MLLQEIPQGSALGLLLFNNYLNDLFYLTESTEACNFADDTTLFPSNKDLNSLIKRLKHDILQAIKWFQNNNMKRKFENIWTQLEDEII